jgi:hypothetical protein
MGGGSEEDLNSNDERDSMCPIDTCSGVCLHVFISSPQDMSDGIYICIYIYLYIYISLCINM